MPIQNLSPEALTACKWIGDAERRANTPNAPEELSRFCEVGSAVAHAARTAGVMIEVNFILTEVMLRNTQRKRCRKYNCEMG